MTKKKTITRIYNKNEKSIGKVLSVCTCVIVYIYKLRVGYGSEQNY